MSQELENQNSEPQADTQRSVPEESLFDQLPVIDENDEPVESKDEEREEGADAGDQADEPKALAVSDELEIVIGDEKVTGGEIKELLTLRENYTQQRQSDTEKVREIQQNALSQVAEKVQDYAAFTNEALRMAENIALGGYTRDQIKLMWRSDPDSAAVLEARATQFDALLDQAGGRVQQWRKEYDAYQGQQGNLKKQADEELQIAETKKFFSQPISQEIKRQEKGFREYAGKQSIPGDRIASFMKTSDGMKIIYQSMLYEQAQQRIKSGKQAPKEAISASGSRPAAKQAANVSEKALYERARRGDSSARGQWLRSAIPTI